jgi:DNA polymerase III delta subunit
MSESPCRLITGDPYLCERALASREAVLLARDPGIERYVSFADEIDAASLDIELRSCSLFALGRHFVIRRVEKSRSAKGLAGVLSKSLPEGTYLTLLAGPLPATNAVLKAARAADAATVFASPKGTALQRMARTILDASGLVFPPALARTLLAACGDDLLSLEQEVDKLRALAGGEGLPETLANGLCFNHTESTVYPFYDRLGEGQLPAALSELDTLREDPSRVVGGIIRHLARLAMIRLLMDRRRPAAEIAAKTGMQDWLCRRLMQQAKCRSLDDTARALRLGVKLDQRIKQGRIAPDDALIQLLLTTAVTTPTALGPSQG